MTSIENVWHHRRVAETASRACMICYKPSSSVLITPDSKDYFYICAAHLKDKNFAVPTDDEAKAVEERKKKTELDKEIAKIKQEYEEKLKAKKAKKDKKDGKKEEKKDEEKSDEQLEKEKEEKIKSASATTEAKAEDSDPRIFRLQKHFYQMRLDKLRNAEMARRNRERLRNPTTFPTTPTGDL